MLGKISMENEDNVPISPDPEPNPNHQNSPDSESFEQFIDSGNEQGNTPNQLSPDNMPDQPLAPGALPQEGFPEENPSANNFPTEPLPEQVTLQPADQSLQNNIPESFPIDQTAQPTHLAEQPPTQDATKTTPKKHKRSFFKMCLKIFFVLVVLVAILIVALPLYSFLFIPSIVEPIHDMTGRQTSLQTLSVNLISSQMQLENFQIKEENGTDNFLKVEKAKLDFSILPLMDGNIEIPNFELSGVYLQIVVDESGKTSFQTIADHTKTSQPPSSTTSPQPKQPLTKLPTINAHVKMNNINVTWIDKRKNQKMEVKNFDWTADIKGLENIAYSSKWEKAQYNNESRQLLLSLVYEVAGKMALQIKDGKIAVVTNGNLTLSNIQSQHEEQILVKDGKITFEHDLNIDLAQGTVDVNKLGMTTDYLTAILSEVKIRNLVELQDTIEEMATTKNKQDIKTLLTKLPLDSWHGKLYIRASLDKLQQDFGKLIAEVSEGRINQMGGLIVFSAELQGKPQGFEVQQKLQISDFYIEGKYPRDGVEQAYRLALEVNENFNNITDFQTRKVINDSLIHITTPIQQKQMTLARAYQKSEVIASTDFDRWNLKELDNEVEIQFGTISQILAPFLPQGTQANGSFITKNSLKPLANPNQLQLTGETHLKLDVASPKLPKKLPSFEIAGTRDVIIGVSEDYIPQKFLVKKFTLDSVGNHLIHLIAQGNFDLTGEENPNLQMKATVKLQELQPYLSAFIDGIQLSGDLEHSLNASSKDQEISMKNQGKLTGFMLDLPNLKGPIRPLRIANTDWSSEFTAAKVIHPNKMEISIRKPSHLQINQNQKPMLRVDLDGTLSKMPQQPFNISNLSLKAWAHGKPWLTMIPIETIQDAQLKQMLTQDLSLDGYAYFAMVLDAQGPDHLEVQTTLDFTQLSAKFQHPELGLIVDKQAKLPINMQANILYQKQDNKQTITLQKCQAKFLKTVIPIGDLMIADRAHITAPDGTSPIVLVNISKLTFGEIASIFPICKQMKLDNATLDFRVDNFLAHLPEHDTQGKITFKFIVPEIDAQNLMAFIKKARENKKDKLVEQIIHGEQPLMKLGRKLQTSLKKMGLDVEIKLEQITFDRLNRGTTWNLALKLNDKEPDNKFKLDFTGKLGAGTMEIHGVADLDRDHPQWNFKYNLNKVPYIAELFGPITSKLQEHVKFPLLEKIQFSTGQSELLFNLKGENTCFGLDPRGIKRSLLSKETMLLEIPSGKFDLGYNLAEFMDPEAIKKELSEKLAPMEATLDKLRGDSQTSEAGLGQLEAKVKTVRDKIATLRAQREPILQQITQAETLAKYQPKLRERLQQFKEKIKGVDNQIAEQEKQQTQANTALKQAQAKVEQFRKQIAEQEAKLAKAREELKSKLQISNPFQFNFDKASIQCAVSNEQPWPGDGDLPAIAGHPFSKIECQEITFQPNSPHFPRIRSWTGLDGKFSLTAIPSEQSLETLKDKLPGIIPALREKGVTWGTEGFSPSPFGQK